MSSLAARVLDLDFGGAMLASQSTNPWMVLVLGGISGVLVFALFNALHVLLGRHRAQRASTDTRATRIWPAFTLTLALIAGVVVANLFLGRVEVNGQGLLFGDDLFAVTRRPGFLASYPTMPTTVKRG